MAHQRNGVSHPPIKIEDTEEHGFIDISETEWLPDAYDDSWEVDSDIAFNLDAAAGIAADTSMHLDLPYLPAANPPGCPHVVDLTQQRVIDAMCNGECALSRVDVLATVLYNYDEDLLKAFLDVDGHSYVRLKINTCKEVPWATRLNGTGSTIVFRDGIPHRQENPSSILIIRALDHVYVSHTGIQCSLAVTASDRTSIDRSCHSCSRCNIRPHHGDSQALQMENLSHHR